MIQPIAKLKSWFLTGLYPTQEQFHDWMDSYWHKSEQLPGLDAKAVEYKQQDLNNVVLTPFKHHLSVNRIDADLSLNFDTLMGKIGIVTLLIHNVSVNSITVSVPEMDRLIVLEETNTITLTSGAYVHAILTGFGDYQTLSYRIKSGTVEPEPEDKYPDVWRENIIEDVDEDVCRIGEQVWARRNVQYTGTIDPGYIGKLDATRLTNWHNYYAWANIPETVTDESIAQTVQEYGDFFGRAYFSGVFQMSIIGEYNTVNGTTGYKHIPPKDVDLKELLSFTLCKEWDGVAPVDDNLIIKTKGVLGVKGSLGDDPDDDKRFTYPAYWNRDILVTGSDKYGLALSGSGVVHRGTPEASNITGSMFVEGLWLYNLDWYDGNLSAAWRYRNSDNFDAQDPNAPENAGRDVYGVLIRAEKTGLLGKCIRTMRYIRLDYEIYSNGIDIVKINNGETIPDGYTVIPRGALRGAYFANPGYSLTQLQQIANKVESVTSEWMYAIG